MHVANTTDLECSFHWHQHMCTFSSLQPVTILSAAVFHLIDTNQAAVFIPSVITPSCIPCDCGGGCGEGSVVDVVCSC